MNNKSYGRIAVGIDIGTTTVSAAIYDIDNKEQLEALCIAHNSYVLSDFRSEQSVDVIMEKSMTLLLSIFDSYNNIECIGITGQMHGIVYIDKDASALSNLINWQDKRGDKILDDNKTACLRILSITGESVPTGYGISTYYYDMINGEVPENAVGIVSIMDYFAMKICGLKKAVIHSSVASSFGLFDTKNCEFKNDKLSLLGIDKSILPSVTEKSVIIGKYKGVPVSIPIGDNQASFLGSVSDNKDSILVNIGTGSQISSVGEYCEVFGDLEIRPLIEGKYLICASALCGGFAYSMVENFFRSYAVAIGMGNSSQYEAINKLAMEAYKKGERGLDVDTSFFGKRSNPHVRGSINMIGRESFTPSNLILGVLRGICSELYQFYCLFPEKRSKAVASGGAVKKNEVLRTLIGDTFNMSVLSTEGEEAATGVSLFSALAAKIIKYQDGFGEYIKYGMR